MASFFGGGSSSSSSGVTQKEQVRKWTHQLNKEKRQLQRDVNALKRAEMKARTELKKEAKKGNVKSCRILAKSIIQSQQTQERLCIAQLQINSIVLQLKTNAATAAVGQVMRQSAHVMKIMNSLISLPQLKATSVAMQKEMIRSGLIEDTIEDTMAVLDESDMEDAVEEEVDAVLYELTAGQLGVAGPLKQRKTELTKEEDKGLEDDEAVNQLMQDRLSKMAS